MSERANSQEPESTPTTCPVDVGVPGRTTQCDAAPYRLPQFTLQFLALMTVLVAAWFALWPITSVASRVVLAVIMLTYLFGCARTRRAALVMLPALFLPHSWIFLIQDYSWSDYRWFWVKMYWQLPGLVPEALVRRYMWRSEWWQFGWMAIFAIAIWLLVVALGRRGGNWIKITALVTFVLSLLCAWIEQNLFRM